jgi:acetyl esterase
VALDSTAQMIVDGMAAHFPDLGGTVTDAGTARAMLDALPRPTADGVLLRRLENISLPRRDAPDLAVRAYWPDAEGTLPGIVFFHGGGFVLSSVDGHDAFARKLAAGAGAVVVSVEYRLAPEHPFPAAADDAVAATEWVNSHARQLGIDPERIVVAGDSAGGNLAAVTCVIARDLGGPPIAAQLLIYPVLDARQDSESYRRNASGYFLTSAHMAWFWQQYLADADPDNPVASPVRAADLTNLPPAIIVVGEHDVLADDGRRYASRLTAVGNQVTLLDYPGMFHGFFGLGEHLPTAAQANRDVFDALMQLWRPVAPLTGDRT